MEGVDGVIFEEENRVPQIGAEAVLIDESIEEPLPLISKPVLKELIIKGKKPKLRTSKDVYHRLKWDAESVTIDGQPLDLSSVYIGYKDRFLGNCEIAFGDFVPFGGTNNCNEIETDEDDEQDEIKADESGEIPFHRVYYFRTGGPPKNPRIGKKGEIAVREDNWPTDTIFIWDRDSRADLVFHSGNSTHINKKK